MRELDAVNRAFAMIFAAACGATPPPPMIEQQEPAKPAITIEWRAAQADNDSVLVTIVVERKAIDLGTLPAKTETEPGTPWTCAVRAAHPLRTEFACGELTSFYAAELQGEELVLMLVEGAGTRRELRRIPVWADGLAVKPYAMPE